MKPAFKTGELEMLLRVFEQHPEITLVKLFGSRAKGVHKPSSDIDLAVWGEIDSSKARAIAADLDELPLPYQYDVLPFETIKLAALREHIDRVGIQLYPAANSPS